MPNLVRVTRPQGVVGTGAQPYSGVSQAKETPIIRLAKAHIQPERQGQAPLSGLPAESAGQPTWKIILKAARGSIEKRDVLTDELGNRYQTISAAWTPLNTTVLAVQLNGLGTPAAARVWGASNRIWGSSNTPWPGTAVPSWGAGNRAWGNRNRLWN